MKRVELSLVGYGFSGTFEGVTGDGREFYNAEFLNRVVKVDRELSVEELRELSACLIVPPYNSYFGDGETKIDRAYVEVEEIYSNEEFDYMTRPDVYELDLEGVYFGKRADAEALLGEIGGSIER